MRALIAIAKALGDPNRVRIVLALSERGELCVCQLQELLRLAPSTTSKHLAVLSGAGLLDARREGRWSYYRLAEEEPLPGARGVVEWACREAAAASAAQADRARLDAILSHTPEELCQLQAQGLACCSSAPATRAAARSPKATPARSRRK
ncbi:MAG: metalloregulator ArsR/SmtB family transcription factor [Candidatus Sumerlaeia bacterium]|nr:metalloregulator ArsR/SmtB family transcription factor [Candidatus Sumerlaeia bacterium]